jgi:ribosome biogenesis SPOUT family RNA methylase Rps3
MKLNEYQEQCLVVEYLDILKTQGKIVMFTAVNPRPNMEHVGQRMKAKKAGLNPGFPDLIILTRTKAICIEMKIKPNKITPGQKQWLAYLANVGIVTHVAYGYEEAKEYIDYEITNEY